MTKIGLMILLAHLKFCWHILNFAGTVFEVKVTPANNLRQQNFAGAAPDNTDSGFGVCLFCRVMMSPDIWFGGKPL
jgi:hypothetical protein